MTKSPEETIALGEQIGRKAPGGAVVAFRGDLGAGKTTFSKGIARGLGVEDEVTSPTYTIVSEYSGRLRLVHIDAYRLGGELDFQEVGGRELLGEPGSLCLVEWSERIETALGPDAVIVDIAVEADGARSIRLFGDWLEDAIP